MPSPAGQVVSLVGVGEWGGAVPRSPTSAASTSAQYSICYTSLRNGLLCSKVDAGYIDDWATDVPLDTSYVGESNGNRP